MGMPKMKRMRRGQTKGEEKLEKPVMTRIKKTSMMNYAVWQHNPKASPLAG